MTRFSRGKGSTFSGKNIPLEQGGRVLTRLPPCTTSPARQTRFSCVAQRNFNGAGASKAWIERPPAIRFNLGVVRKWIALTLVIVFGNPAPNADAGGQPQSNRPLTKRSACVQIARARPRSFSILERGAASDCVDKITRQNRVKCYELMGYPAARALNCNDRFYGQFGLSFSKRNRRGRLLIERSSNSWHCS